MKIQTIKVTNLAPNSELGQTQPVHAVVQIQADDGAVGISRAYASTSALIADDLSPLLVGANPLNGERLWEKVYRLVTTGGAPARLGISALGAIDIALWDLKGKILGCSVHRLLGGFRDKIPAYADGGMFGRGPDGHAAWCARHVERGFRAVKYHVMGERPEAIVETARRIREVIGTQIDLMIDVHKAWDPWLAVATARRLEPYDIYWLEEPVSWDDQVGGMAILSTHSRIPIAAGESECTLHACRDLVERAGIRVLQTDIISAGGYTAWQKLAALAQAHHVVVAPHGASFPELSAPLVAAIPNGLNVSAFPPGEPIELWSRLYREPLDLREGTIYLRDAPGLGLEFDETYLAKHRT